jgi:hypothetical protein
MDTPQKGMTKGTDPHVVSQEVTHSKQPGRSERDPRKQKQSESGPPDTPSKKLTSDVEPMSLVKQRALDKLSERKRYIRENFPAIATTFLGEKQFNLKRLREIVIEEKADLEAFYTELDQVKAIGIAEHGGEEDDLLALWGEFVDNYPPRQIVREAEESTMEEEGTGEGDNHGCHGKRTREYCLPIKSKRTPHWGGNDRYGMGILLW